MKTIDRDAEVKLIEQLSSIQEDSSHWCAVHFAFAQLKEEHRTDNQMRIAINLVKDLLQEHEATLYLFGDSSQYVLVRYATRAVIDKLVFQLRYLFMDDPLAYDHEGDENPAFYRLFDLSTQLDELQTIAKGRLSQRIKGKVRAESKESPAAAKTLHQLAAPADQKQANGSNSAFGNGDKPIDAQSLAKIERDLSNADLSKVMRRQPICAAVPDTMVRRVFDEYYINIAHLKKMLHTDVNLTANRWLFSYLTMVLDGRMLALLERNPGRYLDNPISLNLNIITLLSDEFMRFDASIKPAVKFSIVIEIQLADVFADMSAFLAAKSHVQKLGYRVCLDGVSDLSFTQIDRKKLGFDLIKLQWNADIHTDVSTPANQELATAIRNCGANRVILTRCDNRSAIDYGQALGISLFQGRYLDSLVNPRSTIEN
jgi:EAL domain-containing protein (putative c-di-GMP-specific phosphodiesterase class I)